MKTMRMPRARPKDSGPEDNTHGSGSPLPTVMTKKSPKVEPSRPATCTATPTDGNDDDDTNLLFSFRVLSLTTKNKKNIPPPLVAY